MGCNCPSIISLLGFRGYLPLSSDGTLVPPISKNVDGQTLTIYVETRVTEGPSTKIDFSWSTKQRQQHGKTTVPDDENIGMKMISFDTNT